MNEYVVCLFIWLIGFLYTVSAFYRYNQDVEVMDSTAAIIFSCVVIAIAWPSVLGVWSAEE